MLDKLIYEINRNAIPSNRRLGYYEVTPRRYKLLIFHKKTGKTIKTLVPEGTKAALSKYLKKAFP